jgi:hypothetical protein
MSNLQLTIYKINILQELIIQLIINPENLKDHYQYKS